jgi:hypothetical protein
MLVFIYNYAYCVIVYIRRQVELGMGTNSVNLLV